MLLQAAAAAAGAQHFPTGALYVVATPIGNLADLTLRAIHVLALADAVACEDTRHTAPLMQHLGLDGKPLLAVHEHNEREASQAVIDRLGRGERVAYVSDAGTPAVSDPGAVLVAAVQAAGHRTLPIPGASSAVAAMSVAGSPPSAEGEAAAFCFQGFLSSRAGERAARLRAMAARPEAQVLFEAPHRIESLAAALAAEVGPRPVTLCRELTKQFETVETLPADALPGWLAADANRRRGEFVLVLHAQAEAPGGDGAQESAHDAMLETLLAQLPLKQAVALATDLTRAPRNQLYARALLLKKQRGTGRSTEED